MADNTKIEWADATVNAVNGCSVTSPGCTNCYAMKLAGTRLRNHPSRAGLTRTVNGNHVWTGEVRLNQNQLLQPLEWTRPRRIFWNAHGDLFHENVPDEWIDRVFAVCALTPQHQHLILTKRSARMREYLTEIDARHRSRPYDLDIHLGSQGDELVPDHGGSRIDMAEWPLPNVWLGVSVEDQARADERIPDLLATPAAVRFLSAEPLLGPVDIKVVPSAYNSEGKPSWDMWGPLAGYCMRHFPEFRCGCDRQLPAIDWVIVGGESGSNARPMHPDWASALRDQCQAAGVPFFFKQWGLHFPTGQTMANGRVWNGLNGDQPTTMRAAKSIAGRLLDGREWSEFPA